MEESGVGYVGKRIRMVIKMGRGLGVTLPKRLCEKIDLKVGDAVFVTFVDRDRIVIEPIRPEGRREDGECKENPEVQ